ncbi:hypothetical protein [Aeromonas sp. MdU4]|uniref:hypothetical protein n=1 Tax=Aeromonas sp. MdU4 TaxID=3342819 RepID=UPI0035BB00B1
MWSYLYLTDLKEFRTVSDVIRDSLSALKCGSNNGSSEPVHVFPQLDGLTGGIHYYFSPGAQDVAELVGAKKCDVAPFEIRQGQILVSSRFFNKTQERRH